MKLRLPDWAWTAVCAVVGVLVGLWLTRHAWGPHLIAGGDITADLIRADFGIPHIVAHGRIDGWFPRFMEGQQEFLFNGPGVTWATALLRVLTFGGLSNPGAIKVLAILTIAAEPLAAGYLARSFGLDRLGAGIAGILSLCATAGFGGSGLEGLFVNGLLSHQLGAVPFFLCFGAMLRAFDDPSRRRMVIAGAAFAALAITHVVSVMILAVMLPIALVVRMGASERSERLRGLGGVFGAGAVGFGLSAFWLVPSLAHRDLRGPTASWATDPFDVRIAAILRGQILYLPFIAKLVMLAWLITLVRAAFGHREHMVLLAVPTLYLVITHTMLSYPGPNSVSLQLANRGLAYAGVIALMPVAALVALAVKRVGDASGDQFIATLLAVVCAGGGGPGHRGAQQGEPGRSAFDTRSGNEGRSGRAAGARAARRTVRDDARLPGRDLPGGRDRAGALARVGVGCRHRSTRSIRRHRTQRAWRTPPTVLPKTRRSTTGSARCAGSVSVPSWSTSPRSTRRCRAARSCARPSPKGR